jgi:hypothetical protein
MLFTKKAPCIYIQGAFSIKQGAKMRQSQFNLR